MKSRLDQYLEELEQHDAQNKLLQRAIGLHNTLDQYVRTYENAIRIDEKYSSNAIHLYSRLLTFMEKNWQLMANQLGVDLEHRSESADFQPAVEFIEYAMEEAREELEDFVETTSIVSLNGYSYLHEVIKFFARYDIGY